MPPLQMRNLYKVTVGLLKLLHSVEKYICPVQTLAIQIATGRVLNRQVESHPVKRFSPHHTFAVCHLVSSNCSVMG